MDRFAEKQAQIDQRREEACTRYPAIWSNMIAEWNSPGSQDRAWLLYSANYLFRTRNICWAIDPLTLHWRVRGAPRPNVADDLRSLSFVLLTHRHKDHLDMDLLSALRHLPITWVVPEFLLHTVIKEAGLPGRNIVTAAALKPIEINGIHILPFSGLHWETTADGTRRGVAALGYLIELGGKRWLFPGDTRTYDALQLPDFGPVDQLFAHLWLGRECAAMESLPLLDAFCRFCLDLKPRRIHLAHLNEFGRDAADFWDESHANKARSRFQAIAPDISVTLSQMGENISITT